MELQLNYILAVEAACLWEEYYYCSIQQLVSKVVQTPIMDIALFNVVSF